MTGDTFVGVKPLRPFGPAPLQGGAIVYYPFKWSSCFRGGLFHREGGFLYITIAYLSFRGLGFTSVWNDADDLSVPNRRKWK